MCVYVYQYANGCSPRTNARRRETRGLFRAKYKEALLLLLMLLLLLLHKKLTKARACKFARHRVASGEWWMANGLANLVALRITAGY